MLSFSLHPVAFGGPAKRLSKLVKQLPNHTLGSLCLLALCAIATGCGTGTNLATSTHAFSLQGNIHGGQQPVTGALLQLYAVGTTGNASAATPLLSTTITTSDGSGNASNPNANAGNKFNSMPAGSFTITDSAYTCPVPDRQIYLVGTGGNPGLGASVTNPALAMLSVLGPCSELATTPFININELTTIGSLAPLAPYMTGVANLGSSPASLSAFNTALNQVHAYTNFATGTVPGADLPPGFYASSLEVTTLADILAGCINSDGTTLCDQLFTLARPPAGVLPTNTVEAALDILKNPTNNTAAIFNLLAPGSPFQPTLTSPPTSWALPILPIAATPVITPAAGAYTTAPSITITTATSGATIYYTTNGTTPSTSSTMYTGPFTLTGSATVKTIATAAGYAASALASSAYTLPPVGTAVGLAFLTQPGDTAVGYTIPKVLVGIVDAYGNLVPTSGVSLTAAYGTNAGAGVLNGTKTAVTSKDGSITFSSLIPSAAGVGYTLTISAPGFPTITSAPFTVFPYTIVLNQNLQVPGVGKSTPGTVTLGGAAPAGGVTVSLIITDTSVVTVSPATVFIPAGQTTGTYNITGVAVGSTVLTASAPNYSSGTYSERAATNYATFGTLPTLAPNGAIPLPVTLTAPAPTGGLTVNLYATNGSATISPLTINFAAGATTPTVTPTLTGHGYGTTDLTTVPTSTLFGGETQTISSGTNTATLTPTLTVPFGSSGATNTLTLGSAAPTGGVTFTLSSSPTGIISSASTVTVPAGQTSITFPIYALSVGNATLTATASGITPPTTAATVNGTIPLAAVPLGVSLISRSTVALSNTNTAGVSVTLTSSNPGAVLLSTSPSGAGAAASIVIPTVTNTFTFYEVGVAIGTSSITATAPNYGTQSVTQQSAQAAVALGPTTAQAVTTVNPPTILTTYIGYLPGGPGTSIFVCTGSPTINGCYTPADTTFTLANSNTAVGTLTPTTLTVPAGSTTATSSFQPTSAGTSTISVGSAPANYYAPTGNGFNTVFTVTQPTIIVNTRTEITGSGIYVPKGGNVGFAPALTAPGATLTITSSDPTVAVISTSAATSGSASISYPSITNLIPAFYIQGLKPGTVTLTYTSPGWTSNTSTVTINPAGIIFLNPNTPITTTTVAANTNTNIALAIYNAAGTSVQTICYNGSLACTPNPGTTPTISFVSSNSTVGNITPNPATVLTNAFTTVAFQPAAAGTTDITLGTQPSPFIALSSAIYTKAVATVTAPSIAAAAINTGVKLYVPRTVSLPTQPNVAVTVTISSSNPAVALISNSASTLGSASVDFPGIKAGSASYYVQGLAPGTSTITISAPGYTSGTATITVLASGVVFAYGGATLTTGSFSTPRTLNLYLALLDSTGAIQGLCQNVNCFANPGSSISIPVTSSNPAVGTLSVSPVTFAAGSTTATTTFISNDVGTTTIALGTQPAGMTASTAFAVLSGMASVTGDNFNVVSTLVGEGVYTYKLLGLPSTPGSYPVTVTVALADPIAKLSTNESVMGTDSTMTFTITSGLSLPQIFIQGVTAGNTKLTVSARGYTTASGPVQVMKSGVTLALQYTTAGADINLQSSAGTFGALVSLLDPTTLAWVADCATLPFACKVNPGHSTDVVFGTTDSSIATIPSTPFTITSSAIVNGAVTPVGTGFTDYTVTAQPTGFYNTSTTYRNVGRVSVNNVFHMVGRDVDTAPGLQVITGMSLSGSGPGITSLVGTATVTDTSIAVITTNLSNVGTASVSFTGVANLGATFYVQGLKAGTTTMVLSAPGYVTRTVTIRVGAGGFVLKGADVFRQLNLGNTDVLISAAILNTSGQWIADAAATNPGTNITIPITSSNTGVATFVSSPVAINGVFSGVQSKFHPVTFGTITISVGTPTGFTTPTTYATLNGTVQ